MPSWIPWFGSLIRHTIVPNKIPRENPPAWCGFVCVPTDSQSHFLRIILLADFLIFNVSRAALSSTWMLWSERFRDPPFTFRYLFSAPLTRYLFCRVPQEFAITRSICVSHHRWHSLISCTLSVLYVWITVMTKISIISHFTEHNFHDISSLLSFIVQTTCHQSWGIDNFTLQLSSYLIFFFSIRSHSIRFVCTFCKKADFSDKDLSKYYWISRSFRFHSMKLCGNIMNHFLV